MKQKIPNISDNDIKRIIKRDFPQTQSFEVENILNRYKSESQVGKNRVSASILKLANGNIELVKKYTNQANSDYRDVIALSEYPNFSKHIFESELSSKKKKQLIHDDWMQFETFLNRT